MQSDLNRLRRKKSRRHRVIGLLLLCAVVALVMVMMRTCSDQFAEPYNTNYQPMDTERKQGNNL
ncbi:MAG: hypothetical protein COB41_07490 [Proteobacteria bacterium]|nr:MAG: hypothetical protein COB41_07490 [Pseudomonadota bacterium]